MDLDTPFCNSRQGTLQPLESDWMVSTIRRVPNWYSCPKVLPVGAGDPVMGASGPQSGRPAILLVSP